MRRALKYLELLRIPNTFTAMADVMAGYFIIAGPKVKACDSILLMLSAAGIYAAGCALNDVCDKHIDAKERPGRPIPSGRVPSINALILSCILFETALLEAYLVSHSSFFMASILVMLVFTYDTFTKKNAVFGPLNMGACRAVNLMLGMSPALTVMPPFHFPLVTLIYAATLTALSRYEVDGAIGKKGVLIFAGWALAIALTFMLNLNNSLSRASLLFLAVCVIFTGRGLLKGLFAATPETLGKAVKTMALGIPFLDAVYVSGTAGPGYGILIILFIFPALALSKFLPGT